MASTYKTFTANDIATTKTLLHEAIPITGSIVSGTYNDENIKYFSHGMFEAVYDYPYLSSSANHIFDITAGYASGSEWQDSENSQDSKKINVYNQFCQVLVPYDVSGNIQQFDQDGNITAGGTKMDSCFFLTFSRLLAKDEIKKGSFTFNLYGSSSLGAIASTDRTQPNVISDFDGTTNFKVNSPTGEYGLLYSGSADGAVVGHLYYQAGIAVLTSSIFEGSTPTMDTDGTMVTSPAGITGSVSSSFKSSPINEIANALRYAYIDVDFNNTTELNSSIYFCRANTADYNYSSNPTYLSASKIVVKNDNAQAEPMSFITTVGLYSADNELLAVAKVSEPLKKTPSNELTLRVRLDY